MLTLVLRAWSLVAQSGRARHFMQHCSHRRVLDKGPRAFPDQTHRTATPKPHLVKLARMLLEPTYLLKHSLVMRCFGVDVIVSSFRIFQPSQLMRQYLSAA